MYIRTIPYILPVSSPGYYTCTHYSILYLYNLEVYTRDNSIFYYYVDCFRHVVRDVVFVIDTSSKIGFSRFQLIKELIESIAIKLKVDSPETLFGLITFDEHAQLEFNISSHTDLSTLTLAINPGLPYYTNITNALSLLLSGSGQDGFLKLRDKTSNLAIVITDGYHSSYSSLQLAANSLHAANIFDIFAVGVGGHSYSQLHLIANDPSFVFSTYISTNLSAQNLAKDVIKQLSSSKQLT